MPDFTKMPEALEFIAGQAWLSPIEPIMAIGAPIPRSLQSEPRQLSWSDALRDIAAILRRVGRR